MRALDLVIFIGYFVGTILFGVSFYKKSKSSGSFTLGNKNIPTWVLSMSIFATFVSSISYLAIPGQAYLSNWNAYVFCFSIPLALLVTNKFFIPLYRSINSASAYTYLEQRFGPWARIYASICYLLTQLMRTGTILFLLALVLNALLGWNMALVIAITGIGVMVYTVFGGIQAVIWTDAIQGIILILGALICVIILLFSMPDGPGRLFQIAMDNNKFSLGSFSLELTSQTFWVTLIYGFFINLQNFGIDQNYIQRYMTSSSDKQAKNSTLYGGLLYIPVSILFFFIGTALFSYYQAVPDALPAALQSSGNSDKIFPYFIFNGLPVGVTGLLLAAIFAAGMSTVSSSVNSSATIILTDYFTKPIDPGKKEKRSLKILYIASTFFGILSILVAIAMINVQSVLDVWWKLASIFSGGMLGLFMLGYFAKKINNTSAFIGVISGVLVIGWISLSPILFKGEYLSRYASNFHPYLAIVLGTMTIFVVGFLLGNILNEALIKKQKD